MPRTPDILPHRRRPPGRGRRSAARACRARSSRARASKPSARAPGQRRALEESRAAGTAGASAAAAASSANRFRSVDAREAVGADRDAHAGRVEAVDRRHRRRRSSGCCADRSRSSRPRGEPRQLAVGRAARRGRRAAARRARRADPDTPPGRTPARAHAAFHAPSASSSCAPSRRVPSRRNSISSARLAEVDAERQLLAAARRAIARSRRRRHRVRRVRRERRTQPRDGRQRPRAAAGASLTRSRRRGTENPISSRNTTADSVAVERAGRRPRACCVMSPTSTSRARAPRRSASTIGCRGVLRRRDARAAAPSAREPTPASTRRAAPGRASTTARDACAR